MSDRVKPEAAPIPLHRCRRCGALPREVQTLLDSRKGKSIWLMRCSCREQTWSEVG